ncbi:MAG: cyclic nucleotide-binding domain-containing protein, partial [bacterium]
EKEIVTTMKPGEFFGELGLFSGGKRRAGAVALESSQLLEITRKSVGKMKAEHPEALISMYEEMFESLAGRFDALAQKAEKTQFWL